MENAKSNHWSPELDEHLRTLILSHSPEDWNSIASSLNAAFGCAHKSAQDCFKRWHEDLVSVDCRKPWTDQEELKMLVVHHKYQNKWSSMALELGGRSNNSIKNRFYSIFRKVKNKILKQDVVHESKLELLETLYVIFLMEHYFANLPPIPKQTGKRGKDFIFSLLKGLQLETIIRYRTELQKSDGAGISLDKLWLELVGETFTYPSTFKFPQHNHNTNFFSYITDFGPSDKLQRRLPLPRSSHTAAFLTPEEKTFVHFHAFGNKEPYSAGLCRHGPAYLSPMPTASLVKSAPVAAQFEGFTDFTEKNRQIIQSHMSVSRGFMGDEKSAADHFGQSNLFI